MLSKYEKYLINAALHLLHMYIQIEIFSFFSLTMPDASPFALKTQDNLHLSLLFGS